MKPNLTVRARWILSILYVVLGVSLILCDRFEAIDPFWGGMGTALTLIGLVRLWGVVRYKTDAAYKEQTDTAYFDERNRFLKAKALSWAAYLYIIVAAVATIVFKLLGNDILMYAASGSVCLILVLYWVVYLIIRKKY